MKEEINDKFDKVEQVKNELNRKKAQLQKDEKTLEGLKEKQLTLLKQKSNQQGSNLCSNKTKSNNLKQFKQSSFYSKIEKSILVVNSL